MTRIEWTKRPGTKGESWNFLAGCTKVSLGCDNCYALSMSWRLQNMEKRPDRYEGVVRTERGHLRTEDGRWLVEHHWTGRVNLDYDALEIPYRWKKPRTVFVCSMADLFHPNVSTDFIYSAICVMAGCQQHTFLVLTKRAERLMELGKLWEFDRLPHVWFGVTAENQEQADFRIPLLLQTPAAVRWISVEPMLGPINLTDQRNIWKAWNDEWLDWVVCGAESGPNRREMRQEWAYDLVKQCDEAKIPAFVKQVQLGPDLKVSKDPHEMVFPKRDDEWIEIHHWNLELMRREWPR